VDDGKKLAACLCVDSPGRMSSVFIPGILRRNGVKAVVVQLLERAARLASQRDILFLQAMVAPDSTDESAVYRQAGFQEMAQLIYLESDLTRFILAARSAPEVQWVTYIESSHELFARVVEGTYEESLDCGSFNGMRDMQDILASHRAVGEFDPQCWAIGMIGSVPVGVILLNLIPERCSYEVVYMGVLKHYRGQGYGATLLRRAVSVAREQGVITLSLSVDARNAPAFRLYKRFGFKEVSRRNAWIKMLSDARDTAMRASC